MILHALEIDTCSPGQTTPSEREDKKWYSSPSVADGLSMEICEWLVPSESMYYYVRAEKGRKRWLLKLRGVRTTTLGKGKANFCTIHKQNKLCVELLDWTVREIIIKYDMLGQKRGKMQFLRNNTKFGFSISIIVKFVLWHFFPQSVEPFFGNGHISKKRRENGCIGSNFPWLW